MSNSARNISHEEIVELQEKFSEIKHTINTVLAVMMALSEASQRRPEFSFSEKLASTVLTKAPLIVSRLQEFTQALNEKAPRSPQIVSSLQEFTQALNAKAPRSISSRVRLSLTRLARRCTAGQSQKIEKEITIINRLGLDPVAAAMFIRIACRFRSEIWVEKEGERINGKSIMGLMMLAAGQGSKLHIRCEGPDADRAMQELEELIKNRFNEDLHRKSDGWAQWNSVRGANILFSSQIAPMMSDSARTVSQEEIVEFQKKFSEIKYGINNALAVMLALSEMSQRRPDYSEKLASTVLTKAPQIVSSLQEIMQVLNETAGPKPEVGQRESCMSLASLLSADEIIPEMKATERGSAIVELTDLLVAQGKIKPEDRDSILASLKQREETLSTGIGNGIAIPHASSDRIEEVVASFGRSSQGIEFDALDDAPVKFVVLFIEPKNQFLAHPRTLASIAKFLNDRSIRESLAAAKTADEILAIFRERGQK
jgi:phosphotransferase system HPr (HPr) family protein